MRSIFILALIASCTVAAQTSSRRHKHFSLRGQEASPQYDPITHSDAEQYVKGRKVNTSDNNTNNAQNKRQCGLVKCHPLPESTTSIPAAGLHDNGCSHVRCQAELHKCSAFGLNTKKSPATPTFAFPSKGAPQFYGLDDTTWSLDSDFEPDECDGQTSHYSIRTMHHRDEQKCMGAGHKCGLGVHTGNMAQCECTTATDPCTDLSGYNKKCSNPDAAWVPKKARDGGCQVHVFTTGTTCKSYCKAQGGVCLRGQDNRHEAGDDDCVLNPDHSRQSQADNGCNQQWNDQVCVCDVEASEVINTDKCEGMTGFHQICSNTMSSWAVSVGVGMGHDGCEVHVFTSGGTCAQYCASQNKKCIGGQDNRHEPGDDGCVLDPNHSRQSEAADGCNQSWNDQVCICK